MLKSCKTINLIQKLYSNPISNPRGSLMALEIEKKLKKEKNFRKNLKKSKFYQKIAKLCEIKKLKKNFPWPKEICP